MTLGSTWLKRTKQRDKDHWREVIEADHGKKIARISFTRDGWPSRVVFDDGDRLKFSRRD